MKFIQMELNNFRQFHGQQVIRFSTGKDTNVTLINGQNGAGKTHTLEAINWCFYGDFIENRGALVSKEEAVGVDYGDTVECSVKIWYTHEGTEYVAIRQARAKKEKVTRTNKDNNSDENEEKIKRYTAFTLSMLPSKEEDFKVFKATETGMKEVPDPTITIDRALPSNAKKYFLFDGEKIDQLSKPEHDEEVREAVRNILQLPAIERAKEHIYTIRQEILQKLKKSAHTKNEEELATALQDIDNGLEELQAVKRDKKKEYSDVLALKAKIESDLRKYSGIKELNNRRDDLNRQYASCISRIKNSRSRVAEALSNSGTMLSLELIKEAGILLEERRQKGHIPPGIRESFIKDLIESGQCICGTDLSTGSEGKNSIEKFMNNARANTQLAEEASEIMADLNQIKSVGKRIPEDLMKYLTDWMNSSGELEDIGGRLEDVQHRLEKAGDTDIETLAKKLRECQQDEKTKLTELAQVESKIEEFKEYATQVESEIKKISKLKSATGELARLSQLAEMAKNIFEEVYEEFARKKREEIEEKMKIIFSTLVWKKDQFPDVSLTDNYILELYDRYGAPAREELSAGERQVLSLSFITAMAFSIGGSIPLIMDTPFGRLSSEHRANIVTEIPKITNQWILLVQDEEITQQMLGILKPRIGQEYKLSFQDGCTTLEEVST